MSEVQNINIVEDAEGELRVSSLIIAGRSEVEHRSILQLIRSHQDEFEDFGRVAFEMQPFETAGGTQRREIAHLNEHQATLLITYMRNSDRVRFFKRELVREFYAMRQMMTRPKSLAERSLEIVGELHAEVQRQAQKIEVLEPKAGAWDELASADGDYEVADAAKILARAGVETGRQRLFGQLEQLGWIYRGPQGKWKARQTAVDSGYLAEKPQSHHHPRTGELVLDPPQVRVTVRGLERLRVRLGTVERALEAVG